MPTIFKPAIIVTTSTLSTNFLFTRIAEHFVMGDGVTTRLESRFPSKAVNSA